MRKKLATLLLASLLSSCSALSLSPILDSNARGYHNVVENVTNSILVTNILRARDHAPMHYSDLALINGSVQGSAAVQATFPFGPYLGSGERNSFQLGSVSLQSSPSFTLGTLDTNDFTRGILTPVTPDVIKYFLDQGLDPRVALLIFFEGVKGYGVEFSIDGKPADTSGKVNNLPDNERDFKTYLAIVNFDHNGLYANAYKELNPIGEPFKFDPKSVKDVAGLDFSKVRISKSDKSLNYALYTISPSTKVAFCRAPADISRYSELIEREKLSPDGYRILGVSDIVLPSDPNRWSEVCLKGEVVVGAGQHLKPPILYPRSPQGILEYLGALLRYQEKHSRERGPITLGRPRAGSQPEIFFNLTSDPANARFGVDYGGVTYYAKQASEGDHTLEVLALVTQIFNLHKSAKDIPSIRPVTVIP